MYIFCPEGDSDALYEELDRKTSAPLMPEFKDYILKECVNRGVIVPLAVVTASGTRFDAYMAGCVNGIRQWQVMHPVGACVRYPMSEYIARQIKTLNDVILDELHLYKGDSGRV